MVEFRKSPFQSFAVSGENRQVKPAVNIRRVVFSFFVGSGANLEDDSKESFVFALIVGKDRAPILKQMPSCQSSSFSFW